MGYLSAEVQEVAQSLDVGVQALSNSEMDKIRGDVYSKYTKADPIFEKPLRHLLEEYESLFDPECWKLLGDLLASEEAVLFFNRSDDPAGLSFGSGHSLQSVIENCTGFEFYVTNEGADFLLCFTDDDMLLACGSMAERLRHLTGD